MIRLTVENSTCRLEGLSREQFDTVRTALSYIEEKRTRFGFQRVKVHLMDKKGEFPSGLMVPAIAALDGVEYDLHDRRKVPERQPGMFKIELGEVKPYPEQLEIVEAAHYHTRGTISACTGFGKSIAMALLVHSFQLRTLIVVPNLGLKTQLQDTFKTLFGSLDNVTIENIDSPRLKTAVGYDILIVDESHRSAASTYRKLNKTAWTGIYHRFFFTATPFRSKSSENILLESIAGQIIHKVSYSTAVDEGYICPVDVFFYRVPTKRKLKGNGKSYAGVYSELIVNNLERNSIIASLLTSLHDQKKSTLCLVKEVAHGMELAKMTGAAFAHGDGEDCAQLIDWFSKGKLTTLIATTGVCAEGVDTRAAEYIILAAGGKSKNQLMQSVGRGVRRFGDKESCKVILFRDNSHRWMKEHFLEQVKAIKEEYGIDPVEVEIGA